MSSQRYRANAQRWGESMLRAMDDQLLRCIATISSGRYAGWSGRPSREHRTALRATEPLGSWRKSFGAKSQGTVAQHDERRLRTRSLRLTRADWPAVGSIAQRPEQMRTTMSEP